MSQHTVQDEPVQRTAKPDFTLSSVTQSHPVAHAAARPHTRLENNAPHHVEDEQLIQRVRQIEQQVTADDYQQRSCFDCPNFHNPALVTFQRLHAASEQRHNAATTDDMIQRSAVVAACAPTPPAVDGFTHESGPKQRHQSPVLDVDNLRSPHSVSHQNQSLALSPSTGHPHDPESIPAVTDNPKAPPPNSEDPDELSAPSPNAMKRRKVTSARYTYSHDEIRRLRHCHRSLEARKLGSSAIIVLADAPVAPTPIYVDPNLSFTGMCLSQPIMQALHSLDLHRPSPIQQAAIPRGRFGSDVIAHAKSGTGKTIAFLIIVLESLISSNMKKASFTSVLVLVPTRELADQVADVFRSLSKFMNPEPRALVVKGGTPEVIDERQLSLSTPHVVIGTPGRVAMLIQKGVFVVDHINLLVLDEADRLAESTFSHSVPEICAMLPVRRQTLAFSATFEPWLRDVLLNVMRNPAFFSFPTSSHANDEIDMLRRAILEKVHQYKIPIPGALDAKLERVTKLLSITSFKLCILFINDKRYVAKVLMHLKKEGFQTGVMNASLDQGQRDRTVRRMKQGKLQVIVASDLLARGLDFEDCDLIFQLDVPFKPATYLHRVGRAGRYGRNGSSFLLYNTKSEERNELVMLETSLGSKIAVLDSLNAGNCNPVHQQNEFEKPNPMRFATLSGYELNCKSSQVRENRNGSLMRASGNTRVVKGLPERDTHNHEVRRSSRPSDQNPLTSEGTERPKTAEDKNAIDSHITPVNNIRDPRLRTKDSFTSTKKHRNHLQGSVVKKKKFSPSKTNNRIGNRCEAPGRTKNGESILDSQGSGPRPSPSSASGPGARKTRRLQPSDSRKGSTPDGNYLDVAKMRIGDGSRQRMNYFDYKDKDHHGSSRAMGISTTEPKDMQYRPGTRNETSHKQESTDDKAFNRDASEALIDEVTERGTENFRGPAQEGHGDVEEITPHKAGEGNLEGRKSLGDHEKTNVGSAGHEPYDMWDAYAQDAYDAGFREAYKEAFRMSRDLQDRLQGEHM